MEHDPQVMLSADRIIDMGPQAGSRGGEIVFDGTPAELKKGTTVTGQYLSGKLTSDVCVDAHLTPDSKTKWLTVKNAHAHNLKHLTARIPVGMMTTVTADSLSPKKYSSIRLKAQTPLQASTSLIRRKSAAPRAPPPRFTSGRLKTSANFLPTP